MHAVLKATMLKTCSADMLPKRSDVAVGVVERLETPQRALRQHSTLVTGANTHRVPKKTSVGRRSNHAAEANPTAHNAWWHHKSS